MVTQRLLTPEDLYPPVDPSTVASRPDLVSLARLGFRQIRLTGAHHLSGADPEAAWHLLFVIREAMGVGLRVRWTGSVAAQLAAGIAHFDPPADEGGVRAWPAGTDPYPRVRFGELFAVVESDAEQRRTIREDEFDRLAAGWDVPQTWDPANDPQLYVRIGPYAFARPIRYRVLR